MLMMPMIATTMVNTSGRTYRSSAVRPLATTVRLAPEALVNMISNGRQRGTTSPAVSRTTIFASHRIRVTSERGPGRRACTSGVMRVPPSAAGR